MSVSEIEKQKAIIKSTYLGLFMNVIGPVAIFFAAAFVKGQGFQSAPDVPSFPSQNIQILFFALLFISITDLAATYFIRKNLSLRPYPSDTNGVQFFTRQMVTISLVVYGMNAMHVLYGLVLFILGASIEIMMLFVALTFISYQLFRPRKSFADSLCEKLESAD